MKFDRKKFFDGFRDRLDSTIEQEQVEGLEFLLGQMEPDPFWKDIRHIAYALATVFHETAGSFQPVEEGYYLGKRAKAFQKKLRYFPYFGRGYVQTTWRKNYERVDKAFGIDSVNNPELALDPLIAYKTLTYGMHQGWFTGKKLTDYIEGSECDYVNARRIINGTDKAGLVAGYARSFEKILKASATVPADEPTITASDDDPSATPTSPAEIEQPPSSTETVTKAETGPDGTTASVETTETSFNPATVTQYIPKMKGVRNWLATLSMGGILSTTWAAFNGLPPWALFVLGMVTMAVVIGFVFVVIRYRANLFDLVKHVIEINADPTTNNVQLVASQPVDPYWWEIWKWKKL